MKRFLAIIVKVIKQKSFSRVNIAVADLQEAEKLLIRWVQNEAFDEQLGVLTGADINEDTRASKKERKKFLRKNDILLQLDPFVDQSGILRVGGRLNKSDLEENIKHPIILPNKGKLSELIVESCHRRVRHQGRGITTNEIRNSGYCNVTHWCATLYLTVFNVDFLEVVEESKRWQICRVIECKKPHHSPTVQLTTLAHST